LKVEKSKNVPGESSYARIFPDKNQNCRKISGGNQVLGELMADLH